MDQIQSENNKRIAKNTILLYLRMILVMAVSLYTSRVVLNTLGVNDYGIQNVVGGFVSMFSMISGSIGTAIVRFLTYDLGKGDKNKLAVTFSTSVNIQLITILFLLFLAEIIGVWFLNSKMNIPSDRIYAANWVFQMSLASFCVGLINTPYSSLIVAYERMNIFAYFSIVDVILKLTVAYLLVIAPFDKLIFYSSLLLCVSIISCLLYVFYCNRSFIESRYRMIVNRRVMIEMGKFTGWNYIGACTSILRTQGINIILNMFFGVAINAARGIATQVEMAVTQCIQNLSYAISPQITKSYARKDFSYLYNLICYGAKYTYFLVLIIVIPIIFETHIILELWLKNVPSYTVVFTRLSLIILLDDCICNTLTDALTATGDIKKLHIMVGCVVLPVIPLSYVLFLYEYPPYSCYILCIIALVVKYMFELVFVKEKIGLSLSRYSSITIYRVIPVTILAIAYPLFIMYLMDESVFRFVLLTITSLLWSLLVVLFVGLSKIERNIIKMKISCLLKTRFHYSNV